MRALAVLLLNLVGPIVGRVLAALGLSLITVKGVDVAIDKVKDMVVNQAHSLPSDALSLFLLSGGGVAMNMIFGAITFRLAYWGITRAVKVLGAK